MAHQAPGHGEQALGHDGGHGHRGGVATFQPRSFCSGLVLTGL